MLVSNYYISRRTRVSVSALLRPAGLVVLFGVGFMVLLIAQLIVANKLATDGEKLTDMSRETTKLAEENYLLEQHVVSLSSLTQLNEKAAHLGLVKVAKVDVVTPVPYAYAQ